MPIDKVAQRGLYRDPFYSILKVIKQRGIMTPTTQPLESELIEIEQDLDTEDFLIDDLYELSGTEDSEILDDIDFEKSMTQIYMEDILGCANF